MFKLKFDHPYFEIVTTQVKFLRSFFFCFISCGFVIMNEPTSSSKGQPVGIPSVEVEVKFWLSRGVPEERLSRFVFSCSYCFSCSFVRRYRRVAI